MLFTVDFIMVPNLLQEFFGSARLDSGFEEKIRILSSDFLHKVDSSTDPLLHATAIAPVKIPGCHMTFANNPWTYQLGEIAHNTKTGEDDGGDPEPNKIKVMV
jgi:hypothetical protein